MVSMTLLTSAGQTVDYSSRPVSLNASIPLSGFD